MLIRGEPTLSTNLLELIKKICTCASFVAPAVEWM